MQVCEQHERMVLTQENIKSDVSDLKKDVEYMKQNIDELKTLPKDFYTFQAEIRSLIHVWGIAIGSGITLAGLALKYIK